MDPQDAVGRVRQDVGIGGEQRLKQFPGMELVALRLHDGKHHAGFGKVGDHPDDVEEEALARGQGIELPGFVEVAGPAVLGHLPAAGPDDFADVLEVPDFTPEIHRRLLLPGRVGDALAQAANTFPPPASSSCSGTGAGGIVVKRIERVRDAGPPRLRPISANPDYAPAICFAGEVEVVGKVIWSVRRE